MNFSDDDIRAAIIGFDKKIGELAQRRNELEAQLRGRSKPARAQGEAPAREKRQMSSEARERIAAAQRKRWADFHSNNNKRAKTASVKA